MSLSLVYVEKDHAVELKRIDEIEGWVKQAAVPFWLDLVSPTEEELVWLSRAFAFHPLPIEDLSGINPRPKLEDYPGYVFLVLHSAVIGDGELDLVEVHVFASERFIVISHSEQLERHEWFRHGMVEKSQWLQRGTDFCLYRVMDNIADGYLAVVYDTDDELDGLQDDILDGSGLRSIDPIVSVRRQLAVLRRVVSPTREIASELGLHQYPFIRRENAVYFRDIHNLLVTIFDMTETQRDVASNVVDAHLSAISNRLNDVMKRLTIVATIFLPLSFIASLGGMNFSLIPFGSALLLGITIAGLVLVPVLMLLWFKREGWL